MIERDVANNPWVQAFSANLRLFRKKSGLSQVDFAKRLGTNQSSLSKLELGKYAPTLWQIYRISQRLKVSPAILFGRAEGKPLPKTYEKFRKTFSERLKAAREERDWTQTELAEAINTHQPTYSDIESAVVIRGKSKLSSPDLETIRHIATALKIDGLSLFLD